MTDRQVDVLAVVARHIEERFRRPVADLRREVAADPGRNRHAAEAVHWYGLLEQAHVAMGKLEDELVTALGPIPGELTDAQMAIACRLDAAVAARDGRAMVLCSLLDPATPTPGSPGTWRGARRPAASAVATGAATAPASTVRRAVR